MSKRPQVTLKAILVIIAVLSVPLAMLGSGNRDLFTLGGLLAPPLLFGCIGYLVGGWRGLLMGMLAAVLALFLYAHFGAQYN